MDHKKMGDDIVRLVGGEANINGLVHCATRLRFDLKDSKKPNAKRWKSMTALLPLSKAAASSRLSSVVTWLMYMQRL